MVKALVFKGDKKPKQQYLTPILERKRKHFDSPITAGLDAFQMPRGQ